MSVPGGFATTAAAYREFLEQSGLNAKIQAEQSTLNVHHVNGLAVSGAKIRQWIVDTPLTAGLQKEVRHAFAELSNGNPHNALPFTNVRLQKIYQTFFPASNKFS